MPNVKREGGVLKPIPEKPKMYVAFEMSRNPEANPNMTDEPFRTSCFFGMSGSEDMLRQSIKTAVTHNPKKVYAIFEIVRLIKTQPVDDFEVVDRNMR